MVESRVDFALITAIEVERQALCQALAIDEPHRVFKGARTYWHTQLEVGDRQFYDLVVMQLSEAGNVDAALAVADILKDWQPQAILMVGIAGSAEADVQLGDLVIGRESYYYERCKDTDTGSLPEPIQYPASEVLLSRLRSLQPWNMPIPVPRPDGADTRPKVHVGVIASGEKVIANAESRAKIASQNRKVAAIAMEGYGISAAAWKHYPPIPWVEIRAISDAADAQKDDAWHSYAATVAAEFTKHFLLSKPLPPRNPPHPQPLPPSQYKSIIDELKFGNLVPFLGPGISPHLYIELALRLGQSIEKDLLHKPDGEMPGSRNLVQRLIGLPCQFCAFPPDQRPPGCPMMEGLELLESCPLYIEQGLAVAKMNLRYLSQYYKLTNSLRTFYGRLLEIFEEIENRFPSSVHQFFAELPHKMLAKHCPKHHPGLPYQLIVTTNYDSLLEQAFDAAQQPYDVVYYVADGDDRGKYKHRPYQSSIEYVIEPAPDRESETYYDLPLRDPWGNHPQPHPIILKLYGTWENNFVVAEDHLTYLMSSPLKNLPSSLLNILREASMLFLGYSPNDADLQLIVNRFWPDQKLPGMSWLVHQSKPGDLEARIWEKQRNVELLSICSSLEDFVSLLSKEIETQLK